MTRTFTAVFEQTEGWWIGWVEELPGAFAQERTLDDARASLTNVIPVLLDVRREYDQADSQAQRHREELLVTV